MRHDVATKLNIAEIEAVFTIKFVITLGVDGAER
jgi:hypothetical protein